MNSIIDASQQLKTLLLAKLGVSAEVFDEQENLFDYGLDSVDVMGLVSDLKTQGIETSFIDLVSDPTFAAWRTIIANA